MGSISGSIFWILEARRKLAEQGQHLQFQDYLSKFHEAGAEVLAGGVAGPYGVAADEVMGFRNFVRQAVFVIAQDGTVRYNGVAADPRQLPDVLKVLEVRRTLTQLRRQNFGGHHQSR